MISKVGVFILSFLLIVPIAAANSVERELASADWSVAARYNLAKRKPTSETAWKFMTHYWGDAWVEQGKLCSFRFVDLRHSGELSLVALYDLGGTLDCDDLSIFDKVSGGIEEFDYDVAPVRDDNIDNAVRDLAGDGHWELVVQPYDAVTDEDLWPSVYAWTGRNYTNVSSRYPKFYQNRLASLNKQIASLKQEQSQAAQAAPTPPNRIVSEQNGMAMENLVSPPTPQTAPSTAPKVDSDARLRLDLLQAQADKIERFLGSKDAGMLNAIPWANSDDPRERSLAAKVFAEIGSPEAFRYEQTLSRDADHTVATLASHKINHWNEEDPYLAYPFKRESPGN